MSKMNNPVMWDTIVSDRIADGAVNKPMGSPLTKWKSVEEVEPVKTGIVFRVFLVVAGIICLVVAIATFISLGNIGWAEIGGNLRIYAEDVGCMVVFPILGVVCIWLGVRKRKR